MPTIVFHNLPFRPLRHQVIFYETAFDTELNALIKSNFEELRRGFALMKREFFYLPLLRHDSGIAKKVLYHAPYLTSRILECTPVRTASLAQFAGDEEPQPMRPGLIFNAVNDSENRTSRFDVLPLEGITSANDILRAFWLDERQRKAVLLQEMEEETETCASADINHEMCDGEASAMSIETRPAPVHQEPCQSEPMPTAATPQPQAANPARYMKRRSAFSGFARYLNKFHVEHASCVEEEVPPLNEMEEERLSLAETQRILRELQANVQRLRLEGVSLMAIHEFIDKQEPLSRMVITEDYRIFLPDYNNMEIVMGALPKAVYFLFLRYPEGIVCKHMPDHFSELLSIYRQLRPNTDEARLNLTITKVVNPLGNALNENIARIRRAFVEKFDEHLAVNYIVTGERGQQYGVCLERRLIEWEEE